MKPYCALILAAAFASASCATSEAEKPDPKLAEAKEKPETGPKLIGRVASIPPDRRFVLVQSYGKWESAAGEILTTRGPEDRTANLRVTGEALGEFAAADIQSGTLEIGDAVYSRHIVKPAPNPATPPALPEAAGQASAPAGEIPKNN